MKRSAIFVIGLVFIFSTVVFAVEKPAAKAKEPAAVTEATPEKAPDAAPEKAAAEKKVLNVKAPPKQGAKQGKGSAVKTGDSYQGEVRHF